MARPTITTSDPVHVRALFRRVLGRDPRPDELAERSAQTLDTVVHALVEAPEAVGEATTTADVAALYERLLGRAPRETEVAAVLEAGLSIPRILRMLLASDEHRRHAADERARRAAVPTANMWTTDTARWSHPPGSVSPDDAVIVGTDGFCFLQGGTNAALDHHLGRAVLPADWLDAWQELLAHRHTAAAEVGARVAFVVVPDKLAVYGDRFPVTLQPVAARPVERLRAAGGGLTYPVAELRAARAHGDVYRRADSHMTVAGNRVVHDAVRAGLGVAPADPLADVQLGEHLTRTDLGGELFPPVYETNALAVASAARLVEDNRERVHAVGGHIGIRRVWRNPAAELGETVVVFGDSYAYGDDVALGLSWLLAQGFACVHFVWAPFGWDPSYVAAAGASLVVSEIAERFLVRVPREEIDTRALEEETLARQAGLDPSAAFTR